ncbi:FHA domain-containing protein [bacterium]|nr:FHA domain-containing protein [bacterium]
MPRIEILSGKREGDVVDFPDSGIDIGNRKTAKLCISDPWISWNHAKIVSEDGKLVIIDLGSSNGTWVNGQKVTRQPIGEDDVIVLGRTKIRLLAAGQVAPAKDGEPATKPSISVVQEAAAEATALQSRIAQVEQERDDLARMKEVLERFLDLSREERAAVIRIAAVEGAKNDSSPEAAFETMRLHVDRQKLEVEERLEAAEKRARELEAKLAVAGPSTSSARDERVPQLEKELDASRSAAVDAAARAAAASARAVAAETRASQLEAAEAKIKDLETRLAAPPAADEKSDESARIEALERELAEARSRLASQATEKPEKKDDRSAKIEKLERDLAEASAKLASLASEKPEKKGDPSAKIEKLERDLESARKSAIDVEARAAKLERDLDAARRTTGRMSGGPELDALKTDLAQARAERDDWKRQCEEVRAEIDHISVDQLEREDALKHKIDALEKQLREKTGA